MILVVVQDLSLVDPRAAREYLIDALGSSLKHDAVDTDS